MDALNVLSIVIPCRGSGCRAEIRERVPLHYDLDTILQAHGWQRSGDQVGYWCSLHAPGVHQVHVHQEHDIAYHEKR